MNSRNLLFVLLLMAATLAGCGNWPDSKPADGISTQKQTGTNSDKVASVSNTLNATDKASTGLRTNPDSVELTALVRNAYEWHVTKAPGYGFPLKIANPSDSLFTGIDWPAYNKDYATLKQTGFFADDFLARHRAIAMAMDSSIRQASVEWRNANDGIPLWYSDADDWCNCQDNPDNYWQRLTLRNLKLGDNTAAFNWTWGKEDGIDPPLSYNMKAKKVNGTWKISDMEGFRNYGTVADYNKRMKPGRQ